MSDTARPVVVISDLSVHPDSIALLRQHFEVRILQAYTREDEFAEAAADADAIFARFGSVTRKVIESAPKLRIVARHGVGVDAVDLDAATEHGVVVSTSGSGNAAAVAEYTFVILLALIRKVLDADAGMREGKWDRDALKGMELDGKTIGLVGIGAIGSRVARQALGFGMNVIACDPAFTEAPVPGTRLGSFEEALAASDILSLHPRLNPSTNKMVDAAALAALHPGAVLVNTSRGEVVDEEALIEALRSGHLAGAALDVFAHEPLVPDSPLRSMENVVLSPHVAGQTPDALSRVALRSAEAIIAELSGQRPTWVYNPDVYTVREQKGLFLEPVGSR